MEKHPENEPFGPSASSLADRRIKIRLILKVLHSEDEVVTRLKDVVVKDTKAYLDIAVVNDLWDQWQLDQAFDYEVTNSELSTPTVAKILTINRCTDPRSHYSVPMWAKKTGLQDVLKIDLAGLNDDKIYYELDKIHLNKTSIENHLFNVTYKKEPESYGFINYHLTTSYFVSYKCNLSAFGKGKIECHGRRQVLLGLLINDQGYPFYMLFENLLQHQFLFIWLLLRIHWHICEAHFQLMFDKECLPVRLFFVRRKGHFPKSLC
jgi:hypothetical protein